MTVFFKVKNNSFNCETMANVIKLNIFIQDKESATPMKEVAILDAETTGEDLKALASNVFNIPEEVQTWHINSRTPKDWETLYDCGLQPSELHYNVFLNVTEDGAAAHSWMPEEAVMHEKQSTEPDHARREEPGRGTVSHGREGSKRWPCPACTFENRAHRIMCKLCETHRPWESPQKSYQSVLQPADMAEEEEKRRNYSEHILLDNESYAVNMEEFQCTICFTDIPPGEGAILRSCCHMFCCECLQGYINTREDPVVCCPVPECKVPIEDREIRGIAGDEGYSRYVNLCHRVAEATMKNSFHCKTADCRGWTVYRDDGLSLFQCEVCHKQNCISCGAIHEGRTCKEYQRELRMNADANYGTAKEDLAALELLIKEGKAMYCPGCNIIIQKTTGCDGMQCTMCKIEICWATKGPRWGPMGKGDISGGCRCRVNGRQCHPSCQFCH